MRECLICGAREHVQSCEKIQLCTRCAGVLWDVLRPKLHPESVEQPEERGKSTPDAMVTNRNGVFDAKASVHS